MIHPTPIARLPEDWSAWASDVGEQPFRARQIFEWIHKKGVIDPDRMQNLPASIKARLKDEGLPGVATIEANTISRDTTTKLLVRFADGREVETVIIPQTQKQEASENLAWVDEEEDDEDLPGKRDGIFTLCISSQVGCAMGCGFCASGVAGLKRNLNASEIIAQVLLARAQLPSGSRLRNVVLMGMGEPLHNYDAVAQTLRLLSHPEGIGLSTRRVTLSTSGLVPEIDRLGKDFEGKVQLAVSLHAPNDALRTSLMPINKKYPIHDLISALRRYPLPKRRRITIEYTVIRDVNDSLELADATARLLRGIPVKINLIPMNPVEGSGFLAPAASVVDAFQARLQTHNLPVFVRRRKGSSIDAACGQLALKNEVPKVRLRTLQQYDRSEKS